MEYEAKKKHVKNIRMNKNNKLKAQRPRIMTAGRIPLPPLKSSYCNTHRIWDSDPLNLEELHMDRGRRFYGFQWC